MPWRNKKKLDPVIGRDKEITRIAQILARRQKNNPLILGDPGVGKTAVEEGLAQLIATHKISRFGRLTFPRCLQVQNIAENLKIA